MQPSKQGENRDRIDVLSVYTCMKLVSLLIPVSAIAFLVLKSFSTSISEHFNLDFSHSPLYLFILFNAITFALIVWSHKPSIDEFDGAFPHLCSSYEVGASFDDYSTEECSDVHVLEDDTCGSDGYREDDNDDMDDSRHDEEEYDDLEKRIEDFIAKVNNGWREERLKEKDCGQEQLWIE